MRRKPLSIGDEKKTSVYRRKETELRPLKKENVSLSTNKILLFSGKINKDIYFKSFTLNRKYFKHKTEVYLYHAIKVVLSFSFNCTLRGFQEIVYNDQKLNK